MKRLKILEYFFLFGGIIFGICGLYLIIPAVLSTKKITATGLFAKPDRRIWLNRVSEEISYIYEIDKKKNIGVDHTSIKKVRQINKNGNMSIWICPIYPRINCFDKKVDIIIILFIHSFIYQFFFHIIHRKKRNENRKGLDEDGG